MGLANHQRTDRHLASPIAIVAGTIPLALNQGAELVTGNMDAATVLRGLAAHMRYVLSSVGFLNGYKQPASPPREVSSS